MTTLSSHSLLVVLVLATVLHSSPAQAQSEEALSPADEAAAEAMRMAAEQFWSEWEVGPGEGALGTVATVDVPEAYLFGDGDHARTLLEMWENPTSDIELGCVTPAAGDEDWYVFFEFDPIGYVRDDEQNDLDADAILASLREGNKRGNDERRRRGWPTIELVGWAVPPRYEPTTHNLEWATIVESENGSQSVNYSVRLLGRSGVMSAELLCDPTEMEAKLPEFRRILAGFGFVPGGRYAEFRQGDKVAAYGLSALVAGGAVAGLAKAGLLKKLLKPLLFALLFAGGAIWRLFGRRSPAQA